MTFIEEMQAAEEASAISNEGMGYSKYWLARAVIHALLAIAAAVNERGV